MNVERGSAKVGNAPVLQFDLDILSVLVRWRALYDEQHMMISAMVVLMLVPKRKIRIEKMRTMTMLLLRTLVSARAIGAIGT